MDLHLEYPATPANAAKIAKLMIEPAQRISKVELDFSVASPQDIDRIVRRLWREVGRTSRATETVFGFGCYVGEVFVRQNGAPWRSRDQTPLKGTSASSMVLELANGQVCDPIERAFSRFRGGRENLRQFYAVQTGKEAATSNRAVDRLRRLPGRK
jgi:hypothetical protein